MQDQEIEKGDGNMDQKQSQETLIEMSVKFGKEVANVEVPLGISNEDLIWKLLKNFIRCEIKLQGESRTLKRNVKRFVLKKWFEKSGLLLEDVIQGELCLKLPGEDEAISPGGSKGKTAELEKEVALLKQKISGFEELKKGYEAELKKNATLEKSLGIVREEADQYLTELNVERFRSKKFDKRARFAEDLLKKERFWIKQLEAELSLEGPENTGKNQRMIMLKRYFEIQRQEFEAFTQLLPTLPFVIRLYILDFFSCVSGRFYYDSERYDKSVEQRTSENFDLRWNRLPYLFSYQKSQYIDLQEYMRLLFGYFKEDFSRKIHLVFGFLVFRNNRELQYLPIQQRPNTIRQLYVLNGHIPHKSFEKLPTHLTCVCFSDIDIELESLLYLVNRLTNLTKFSVQRMQGVNSVILAKALHKCKIVRIMNCSLEDKVACELFKSPNLMSINLNNNKELTTQAVASLMTHQHDSKIVEFRLNNTLVDDRVLDLLLENPHLRDVQISRTCVSSKGFWKFLAYHKHVRCIEMMDQEFEVDYTFPKKSSSSRESEEEDGRRSIPKTLKHRTNIEKVHLDCSIISANAIRFLCTLPNLSEISLIGCEMEDSNVEYLLKHAQSLNKLHLGFNEKLTDATPRRIAEEYPNVRHLEYCQLKLSKGTANLLFSNPNLEYLFVQSGNMNDSYFDPVLRTNFSLKILQISHTNSKITAKGEEFIKKCTPILMLITGTEERPKTWLRDGMHVGY